MNIDISIQEQYATANYLGAALFVLGLISIGIATGLYMGIQSVLSAGCPTQSVGAPSTCQVALKAMNTQVLYSLVAGVIGMVSGGAIMYYLRRKVP